MPAKKVIAKKAAHTKKSAGVHRFGGKLDGYVKRTPVRRVKFEEEDKEEKEDSTVDEVTVKQSQEEEADVKSEAGESPKEESQEEREEVKEEEKETKRKEEKKETKAKPTEKEETSNDKPETTSPRIRDETSPLTSLGAISTPEPLSPSLSETASGNEYERQRQENILKNKLLLQQLKLDAASLGKSKPKTNASRPPPTSKSKRPKKEPTAVGLVPRRQSSRLAGLPADSGSAKRKAEEHNAALEELERQKRARVAGDLKFEGLDLGVKYARTFTEEDVKKTDNKDIRKLREKMMGLKLYEKWVPNNIKATPERIYTLAFHPTTDKKLIFAGDKVGNLGIWDASSSTPHPNPPEDEPDATLPAITTLKVHSRSIASLWFPPTSHNTVLTASYDGTIRSFDLAKGVSTEVYVNAEGIDEGISSVEVHNDPHVLYFSTLEGRVGRKDTRTNKVQIWSLSEKKIGGFSIHPLHNHLCVTASLDRTLKIWDLRRISGTGVSGSGSEKTPALIGEHASRLSVSSAYWNAKGTVVTTSYDDTIKLYKFPEAGKWASGAKIPAAEGNSNEDGSVEPAALVGHNNQTGRWVTILRAQWQHHPRDGIQKFVIGNMDRFLDIYDEDGTQLAQLGHDWISAVPAAAMFHPTEDWVAGGNASGKITLFF